MSKQQWALLNTDAQKLQLFGTSVKVTTNYEDEFQGFIQYCDENIIILSKISQNGIENDEDLYLINQEKIKDLQTQKAQDPKQTLQNLLSIDLAALAQEMIRKEIKEPHQQLFDHLQKLYRDVEWNENDIVIPSISIKICPPYNSDNISGENKKGVERLKKIVDKYAKSS